MENRGLERTKSQRFANTLTHILAPTRLVSSCEDQKLFLSSPPPLLLLLFFSFCSPHFPSSSFLLIPPPPLLFSRSAVLLISTAHSTPKSFFIHHPLSLSPLLYIFFLSLLSFSHTLHNVWHSSFGCFLKISPSQVFYLGALRRNSPPCHPSKVRPQDRHTLLGPD